MSLLLRTLSFVLLSLALLVSLAVAAQPASLDEPAVDAALRQLLQDHDYPAAVAAIDKALAQPGSAPDYLWYLKGRALHLQQQSDAAVATLQELGKRFPQSPWARRARFATGVALAKKGDFRAAELIYRAEAEALLSPAHKQELAGELQLPSASMDGDEAEVRAVVGNDAVEKGSLTVVLVTRIGTRSSEEKRTLEVTAKGTHEVPVGSACQDRAWAEWAGWGRGSAECSAAQRPAFLAVRHRLPRPGRAGQPHRSICCKGSKMRIVTCAAAR